MSTNPTHTAPDTQAQLLHCLSAYEVLRSSYADATAGTWMLDTHTPAQIFSDESDWWVAECNVGYRHAENVAHICLLHNLPLVPYVAAQLDAIKVRLLDDAKYASYDTWLGDREASSYHAWCWAKAIAAHDAALADLTNLYTLLQGIAV